ncbi:hypothetical protein [Pseudoduganella ginsengisoli]|uniref:Lipocalin-like domain-containing protein n=1 Tax=Pseudoduganella ginsengisoli TaxID=1462440 RepID=A0A6L6PVI3_9BURK|nr:hypothetical protein [Pseudoduganella ginsengisoli]MTW00662.1 hypothetical protein [Pseudoduganella ginsengisoli]
MVTVPYVSRAAPATGTDIHGKWRVVSVLDSAEITGVSEQRARSYVGQVLHINADGFRFQNMTCKRPSFAESEQETAHYLRKSWHARSGNLGLPDRVTVIDARCTDVFLKGGGVIVFNWKGYFLEAAKVTGNP